MRDKIFEQPVSMKDFSSDAGSIRKQTNRPHEAKLLTELRHGDHEWAFSKRQVETVASYMKPNEILLAKAHNGNGFFLLSLLNSKAIFQQFAKWCHQNNVKTSSGKALRIFITEIRIIWEASDD